MSEKYDENCIFCNISQGKVPSKKIYEDESVIAILDINPANPGHVILLTKEHFKDYFELPDQLTGYIFLITKAISKTIERNMKVDGINIMVNHGQGAGQIANHFMLHIIPRFKDDGINLKWEPRKVEEADLDKILETLKSTPIQVYSEKSSGPEKIEVKKEEKQIEAGFLSENLNRVP